MFARISPPAFPPPAVLPHAAGLRLLRASPTCAETPLEEQRGLITLNDLFYLRNNFPYPKSWPGLRVGGAVTRPPSLDLADLARFGTRKLVTTLECAGNGRSFLSPAVAGEQWRLGAVSTAEWAGISLTELLDVAGVSPRAVEIRFDGADGFARSLPIQKARHPDTLVVLRMNGAALPPEHGGPLRLLVPGWYGMASVKWLAGITALTEPFRGHFQVERYVVEGVPVREMNVRAVITRPQSGAIVEADLVRLAGYAWTGRGQVTNVELSDDDGRTWTAVELTESAPPYGWSRWQAVWVPHGRGQVRLEVRATDSAGRVQPRSPIWNELGYCSNGAVACELTVT